MIKILVVVEIYEYESTYVSYWKNIDLNIALIWINHIEVNV